MEFNSLIFPTNSRPGLRHRPAGIYSMFTPPAAAAAATKQPTIFASTTLMAATIPSNARPFTTHTFPTKQEHCFDAFTGIKVEETAEEKSAPSAGTYLFGMVARIFQGILNIVEDVVSPKKVSFFVLSHVDCIS